MIHMHITAWALAIVLFLVALSLHKSGKAKGFKILHMILRVLYLLVIGSGAAILFSISTISTTYIIKVIAGLWTVSMIEMILVRTAKGKSTSILWVQFVIALIAALYLGYKLPLGVLHG